MDRSRGWCFTLNNYTEDEFNAIKQISCEYLIVGKEVGKEGTPHLQGFIYFETLKSFKQLKVYIPRAHIEKQKGSADSNQTYCSKDGDVFEKGTKPLFSSVARCKKATAKFEENWAEYTRLAKAGDIDKLPDHIKWRYYRTAKEIARDYMPKKSDAENVTGIWIYGPSGCGKSKLAREMSGGVFYPKLANKWWDGYQNEDWVILDDVDLKHDCLGYHLKIWSDRYNFIAETKGGAINIRPKHFVVTSQYTIAEIWASEPATIEALERRFVLHTI